MISDDAVDAYNTRLTLDPTSIRNLTPAQRDQVRVYGSQAEALLKNRDLAMFVHHYKFTVSDALIAITGHTAEANAERVALANHLAGVDAFVSSLKRAVHWRSRLDQQDTKDLSK
jgi:predicted nucleic acid-binding protein